MTEKFILCIFHHNRLLDRDQVGDEETTLDDEDENGFLKAFKVDYQIICIYIFVLLMFIHFGFGLLMCRCYLPGTHHFIARNI